MDGFLGLTSADSRLALAGRLVGEEAERLKEYKRAWEYYWGETEDTIEVEPGEPDDNVRLNVVQMSVDAGTDFLFGQDFTMDLESSDEGEVPDEPQQYVRNAWEASGGSILLQDTRTNGAICGTAFVKIQVEDGQPLRAQPPRLIGLDPSTVGVTLDQHDRERVIAYRITWSGRTENGEIAAFRQRIERDGIKWVIYDEESAGLSSKWRITDTTEWNYEFSPIVHCKNMPAPNEFHGRPDITADLLDLQLAINAVASDGRHISRLLGHPLVWFSGVSASQLSAKPGDAVVLPQGGNVGVAGVPATPDGQLALLEKYKSIFHEQVRVPEIVAGRLDNVGQLSGLALRILYGPLVRRTLTQRQFYGEGRGLIGEVNRRILRMAEFEEFSTAIRWPDIVPNDEGEDARAAQEKQRAGVSRETSLGELGYDAEEEALKREKEQDERATEDAARLAAFDEL